MLRCIVLGELNILTFSSVTILDIKKSSSTKRPWFFGELKNIREYKN